MLRSEEPEKLNAIHSKKNALSRRTAGEVAMLYGRSLKALGRNDEALDAAVADFGAARLCHRIQEAAETACPTVGAPPPRASGTRG